jgi:hypothetical protein
MRKNLIIELGANPINNIYDSFVFTIGLDGGVNGAWEKWAIGRHSIGQLQIPSNAHSHQTWKGLPEKKQS